VSSGESPPADRPRPTVMVKLPGITLTGAPAVVALLVLIGSIVALIVWIHPTWNWSPLWISAALWLAFTVYWNAAARNAAPTTRAESKGSRQLHQTMMNLALILLFARIPGLTGRLLPRTWAIVAAGLVLHAGCALLAIWARRHLGRNWSFQVAVRAGHELIRSGPYRRLRHPIYTGMVGMCIATALVCGELHAAIGVALMIAAYVRKIRLEELQMSQLFGAAYADYRKESWALLPGVI